MKQRHIYHHLTNPVVLRLGDGAIYHQYGSTIGRVLFTSQERRIVIEGDWVVVKDSFFIGSEDEAGITVLPNVSDIWIEGNVILAKGVGIDIGAALHLASNASLTGSGA